MKESQLATRLELAEAGPEHVIARIGGQRGGRPHRLAAELTSVQQVPVSPSAG